MKPDLEYYARAVKKFGIDPRTAVLIDDLSENVDGAIRSGLHGITFADRPQLLRELADLGVQVPGNGA
ncbi:MAG: HAD-IA family hydrolase [Desulfomonile tiedjei]|nr:HAD-IA family hydrolase [Desulfomonile tiedjei]